ncbi:MAG: phosphoenolpyruvate carboxykinase (ATP), partial [Cytophagales bacterium]
MQEFGLKSSKSGIETSGIESAKQIFWNLTPAELTEHALLNKEGVLAENGALMCDTGKFTGRSPKDKFVVKDENTEGTVWWGDINFPFTPENFDALEAKMLAFIKDKTLYVRDAYAGEHPDYRLNLRVINTQAWQNLFCYNMFLRPNTEALANFIPNFKILCVPEFEANPTIDGTRQSNFTIVNFTKRTI